MFRPYPMNSSGTLFDVGDNVSYTSAMYSEGRMNDSTLEMIWEALGDEKITTRDASERLDNLFGYRCPDDLAKTLSKYRKEGTVKGEISMDLGGWVWWVDDECRSKGGEQ